MLTSDVIWQLFVGAGGRFLMAWIAYKVFMDGLTRHMEASPVSYQLYASLTFSTNTLFASWYAVKGVWYTKGWRSKIFLAWFSISTIYMLGFPTLMSATAGYLTPSTAGYQMNDGVFVVPQSPQLQYCYNVTAGALIGYENGTTAHGPPVSQLDIDAVYTDSVPQVISTLEKSYSLFASLYNGEISSYMILRHKI